MIFHSFPGRCVFCSVLDLLCPLFVCCFLCGLFLGFVCLVHFSSDVLPCILWQFRCAQDWPSWLQLEPQVSVVLSHSTMDYYHWIGYEQRTLWSHHFVQVHQHKGFYPLQTKWSEFWPVRFPRGKAVDSERAVEREIIWGTQDPKLFPRDSQPAASLVAEPSVKFDGFSNLLEWSGLRTPTGCPQTNLSYLTGRYHMDSADWNLMEWLRISSILGSIGIWWWEFDWNKMEQIWGFTTYRMWDHSEHYGIGAVYSLCIAQNC